LTQLLLSLPRNDKSPEPKTDSGDSPLSFDLISVSRS
jgi:hypothetical protein